MTTYVDSLRLYAVFDGKTLRRSYWLFCGIHLLLLAALWWVDSILALPLRIGSFGFLTSVYFAITALPWLAATVRRLHDTNRSGWVLLYMMVPLIGQLLLLIFLLQQSHLPQALDSIEDAETKPMMNPQHKGYEQP